MSPTDKPTDDIIEDDTKIDRWFKNFVREQERKLKKGQGGDPRYSLERERSIEEQLKDQDKHLF